MHVASETHQRRINADRILARVPRELGAQEQREVKLRTEAYLFAPSPGIAYGAELELRHFVQRLKDDEKKHAHDISRANQLRSQLRGLPTDEVNGVLKELEDVERGVRRLDDDLETRAAFARDHGRKLSDRMYATEVLRSEFERMGYEVGAEFTTVFIKGGSLLACRANDAGYAVQISIAPSDQAFDTRLVRLKPSNLSSEQRRVRDKEAEEAWCEDYAKILAGAASKKLRARVTRRLPAGSEPVPVIGVVDSPIQHTRKANHDTARRPRSENEDK